MKTIQEHAVVTKRNVLNEVRETKMTLQELRFFTIYLSKINIMDEQTRSQEFALADFQRIMELKKINLAQLKETTARLVSRLVTVDMQDGGYEQFHLFDRCRCEHRPDGWYITFRAHEDAMPLLFRFKREYFRYELWNALRLESKNQLRMYEILKQYEKIGERRFTLPEIRSLLGIDSGTYDRFDRFKVCVLDACQTALAENTDIKYTYTLEKHGRGGRVAAIVFTIMKNDAFSDPLSLRAYMDMQKTDGDGCIDITEFEEVAHTYEDETLEFLSDACDREFDEKEMRYLYDLVKEIPDDKIGKRFDDPDICRYHYLKRKYDEMQTRDVHSNRYRYFCRMLASDGGGKP